ncbi:hypothetical protein RIX76_004048 [Salmonella enterica]|nr:hypothetical protein [Salmonella enterica]
MREKIKTPVVIINKRETSDSYVVSVTDGSNNFHDGVLLVGVKPVEKNDRFAVFSMAGYYMAAEMQIVNLKQNCENDPRIHEIVDLKESVAELAAENVGMKELIEQHANSVAVCPNCSHEEPSETDDIVALYRSMEPQPPTSFWLRCGRRAWRWQLLISSKQSLQITKRYSMSTPLRFAKECSHET